MRHLLLLALLVAVVAPLSPAIAATRPEYFPIEEVRPGLRGYGMTVFEGTQLERFDVEVLGVMEGVPLPKQRLIIVRLSGPRVETTRVFAGMSGSPVYFDGRLAGAVAYAFNFSTEPIAGVTPILQMTRQLTVDRPVAPRPVAMPVSVVDVVRTLAYGTASAPSPLASLPPALSAPVSGGGALALLSGSTLAPIATPVAFSGIPQSVIKGYEAEFTRLGILPVFGASGGSSLQPLQSVTVDTLKPGSSVVVQLVRGDYSAAAAGTVTERVGDRVLAFGHPFLGIGGTDLPMAESEVVTVVSSLANSFKLATATRMVGTIGQDRSTGVGGTLNKAARMVPVHVTFRNSLGESETFDYEIVRDPILTPVLANMTLGATMLTSERQFGPQTVAIRSRIKISGQPDLTAENRFSGASAAGNAAALSVAQALQLLLGSGFEDVCVEGLEVDIVASEQRKLGTLAKVWVDTTRVARGDTVTVTATVRTESGDEFVERIPIAIPRDVPAGPLRIVVGDGATMSLTDEVINGFVPGTLSDLCRVLAQLRKNDRLYVQLTRPASGALIKNQPLTALPPSIRASMGSARASSAYQPLNAVVVSERELKPGAYIVTGLQAVDVRVVR